MATATAPPGAGGGRQHVNKTTLSFHDLKSLMLEIGDDDGVHEEGVSRQRVLKKSASDVHGGLRKGMARSPLAKQASANALRRNSSTQLTSWEYLKQRGALPVNTRLSSRVEKKLSKMCRRALVLLERLEQPVSSKVDMCQEPALPASAIRFSKALVFFWHRKAGAVGSYTWGHGFVIYNVSPGVWSAPVFIKDRYISLGLTFGVSASDAIYAIPDNAGIVPFIRTSYHCDGDFEISSGVTPYDTHHDGSSYTKTSVITRANAEHLDSSKIKKYEVDTSVIVDMSVKCGIEAVDESLNTALYMDKNLTPRDILDGAVEIPSSFYPLYEYLRSRIENRGQMERQTTHLFEKERVKNVNRITRSSVTSSGSKESSLQRWKSAHSVDSAGDTWRSSEMGEQSPGTSCLFGDDALLEIDLGDP